MSSFYADCVNKCAKRNTICVYCTNNYLTNKRLPIEIRYDILSKIFSPLTLFYDSNIDVVQIYNSNISKKILIEWGFKYPNNSKIKPGEIVEKIIDFCKRVKLPYYAENNIIIEKKYTNQHIYPNDLKNYAHNVLLNLVAEEDIDLLDFMLQNNIMYHGFEQYFKNLMFTEACYRNKLDMCKYLLSIGAEINADDSKALFYAMTSKHEKIVKFLLENGSNTPSYLKPRFI